MPYKPKKPCSYPGCPEVTHDRYCDKHKTKASREYDSYSRLPDHDKTYGYRWRLIRNRYIQKHPLCEECLKAGRFVPADEIHHILPPELGGSNEDENLMALCKSCHTKTRNV
jgi:5-methylcytosine-specific restriction protein A